MMTIVFPLRSTLIIFLSLRFFAAVNLLSNTLFFMIFLPSVFLFNWRQRVSTSGNSGIIFFSFAVYATGFSFFWLLLCLFLFDKLFIHRRARTHCAIYSAH